MTEIITLLSFLVPLSYLLTTLLYGIAFFRENKGIVRFKTGFLLTAILLHFSFLVLITAEYRHPPFTTIYEAMLTLGFTLALAYLLIELVTKIKNTGFFITLISTILITVSVAFLDLSYGFQDVLKSEFVSLHVVFALVGYCAFTLSATYGLLYLILYNKIKLRKFDFIYRNIPNLEIVEFMLAKAIIIGFIALTLSILIGVLWLPKVFPGKSFLDIKLFYSLLVWIIYCIFIFAKKALGLHGRKIALASIIVLVVLFMLMMLTNYLSGFHNFN